MSLAETGFKVLQPGLLTLIQDAGRFGYHRIGLTNGGPLDMASFRWANQLCGNPEGTTALEVSIGGLVMEAQLDTYFAVTGANLPLKVNGIELEGWQTHAIKAGDRIELGFTQAGARAYLAVAGGFSIPVSFASSATVTREGIGGLTGDKLQQGDFLPCAPHATKAMYRLAAAYRPSFSQQETLRLVLGYQHASFDNVQKRLFFSSEYRLTDRADRMGFRLEGQAIRSSLTGILSEGICHGAVQIPADGQPIVLLNDRQTIGGYPKIGSVISLDTAKLSQLLPGSRIHFEEVSIEQSHNLICLAEHHFANTPLERIA